MLLPELEERDRLREVLQPVLTEPGELGVTVDERLRRGRDDHLAPMLPQGDVGWWHDRAEGPWGSYVRTEAIPAALKRSGADHDRVAIGGISMGGFGALDLGRLAPDTFCAVGGHSPAIFERFSDDSLFGFDNQSDFDRHDLLTLARGKSPYKTPVWIDVGEQDPLRPAAEKLADELKKDGADITFHTWPGEHAGPYWDRHFADYLDFYANACS